MGLVINDFEAASVKRPANDVLQDASVMAGIKEAAQYGLVTSKLSQEDWDNELFTIVRGSATSVRQADNEEKHPALAGMRMTGTGRMRIQIRKAAPNFALANHLVSAKSNADAK